MYQEDPQKVRDKDITTYQKGVLEETVTTYQERLASYPTKMLQRIRNL